MPIVRCAPLPQESEHLPHGSGPEVTVTRVDVRGGMAIEHSPGRLTIVLVYTGECRIDQMLLSAGQAVLLSPEEWPRMRVSGRAVLFVVRVHEATHAVRAGSRTAPLCWNPRLGLAFALVLDTLFHEGRGSTVPVSKKRPTGVLIAEFLKAALVPQPGGVMTPGDAAVARTPVAAESTAAEAPVADVFSQVTELVRDRRTDPTFSAGDVPDLLHRSASTVQRACREHGTTVRQMLRRQRVELASVRLGDQGWCDVSMDVVAHAAGFVSARAMRAAFLAEGLPVPRIVRKQGLPSH